MTSKVIIQLILLPGFGAGADPCCSISFSKSFSLAFKESFSGLSECESVLREFNLGSVGLS